MFTVKFCSCLWQSRPLPMSQFPSLAHLLTHGGWEFDSHDFQTSQPVGSELLAYFPIFCQTSSIPEESSPKMYDERGVVCFWYLLVS